MDPSPAHPVAASSSVYPLYLSQLSLYLSLRDGLTLRPRVARTSAGRAVRNLSLDVTVAQGQHWSTDAAE